MKAPVALFEILVIQADGSGDNGIRGGEHPAQDGNEMHSVKDHPVADCQAFMLADEGDAGGRRQFVSFAAIVQHGKSIIIAFYESRDDGCDPANQGEKGKDEDGYGVHGLPEAVAKGQANASLHIPPQLPELEGVVFFPVDEGLCLFAEIGKDGGADDQEQIFEQGKIEEYQDQSHHDASHEEDKAQEGALLVVQPFIDTDHPAEPGDGGIGGLPEKIHTHTKEQGIKDTGDNDPFPQPMLTDELMSLVVGLEGYDNLF